MKHIKHLFALCLLLCTTVATAHDFEVDGICYNITDATKKTVEVTFQGDNADLQNHSRYNGKVVIPESVVYKGTTYRVTGIGLSAFDTTYLESIVIPASVETIGRTAFLRSRLTEIEIPNSIVWVEHDAFSETPWYANQPDGAVYVGKVLYGYKGTMPENTSFVVEDGTTGIAAGAFNRCTGLTNIEIPNSVMWIGQNAFSGTTWYNNQPDGAVYVGKVLYGYKGTMPRNTSIAVEDGTLGIAGCAFENCSGLMDIEIPNSVKSIGYQAFCRSGLKNIKLPDSVINVGIAAFSYTAIDTIEIPNSVTRISPQMFYCSGVRSIKIPNSVTIIDDLAFFECRNLTSIELPNSVVRIAYEAFERCYNLVDVELSNGIIHIGMGAFFDCENLDGIEIPGSVVRVGAEAFRGCGSLANLKIGNGVESIGTGAFSGCSKLTSIEIPESVTFIGGGAFIGCTNASSIAVAEANLVYDSRNSCNAIIETAANTLLLGCQKTVIPNSVTSIGDWAFCDCIGLTSIVIPNSVASIGESAFYGCTGLTSIVIPNSVTNIGEGVFGFCSALESIVVDGGNAVYDSRENCNAIIETATNTLISGSKNTIIPNDIISIGDGAFSGCDSLTSIEIPGIVTSIGENAFRSCTGLTRIEIPNSVTSIGDQAFYGCRGLKSLMNYSNLVFCKGSTEWGYIAYYAETVYNAPNGYFDGDYIWAESGGQKILAYYLGDAVELKLPADCKGEEYAIGAEAFAGCIGLVSVEIPNSVIGIGNSPFYGCDSLAAVHICSLSAWCNIDFVNDFSNPLYYAHNLYLNGELVIDLIIPNEIEAIKDYTFTNCTGLASVEIPNSVTSIGGSAFYGCKGLTSVEIPNSVTSIGNSAFYGCKGLTSIEIPNSVTSIGYSAFYGCRNVTELIIGDNVETIGSSAFQSCKLTSVTIPASVTSIGTNAFGTSLTEVTSLIPAEELFAIPEIISHSFMEMLTGVCKHKLYVPIGAKETYAATDGWSSFGEIIEVDFTGIDGVSDEVKGQSGKVKTVYNLQGKKIDLPSNGIYIVDGKKVLVK